MREDIKKSIDRYVHHGIPTGGFLRAVLANDLMEAFARADDHNRLDLFSICQYIHNDIPAISHGSYELVQAWISKRSEDKDGKLTTVK